jgi:hypothetical protein
VTHQLLIYDDGVNLLNSNIHIIKRNTGTVLHSRNEVNLEANAEKTKYMSMSRHQNTGQNRYIKVANKSFENMAKFSNQNCIDEEIKKKLHSKNSC